jgi:hypothetical protein
VVHLQHLFAGGGFQRLVSLVGEQIDEQRADRFVIVGDEDAAVARVVGAGGGGGRSTSSFS